LQIPIPFIMGSLLVRMRFRGKHKGHQQLSPACSPTHRKNSSNYENIDLNKGRDWVGMRPGLAAQTITTCSKSTGFLGGLTIHVLTISLTTAAICFIYDGLQSAFGGYVYSYAVKSIADLNKTEGAYLNACFWGMFALGRLIAIFGATRLSPSFMLVCNIGGCLVSMILMLGMRHDHVALYFGTCFFRLFISSITPTALSLAEQYIDVTSQIMASIVVIAALGEMVFPVIVGNIFVTMGPVSFLWFGTVATLISVVVFTFLWITGQKSSKYRASGASSFVWAHLCCWRPQTQDDFPDDSSVPANASYYSHNESDAKFELSQVNQNPQSGSM